MTEKFDYYDVLGTLVPGVLLIAWTSICFPGLAVVFAEPTFPEAFSVVVCIAAAVFVGQLIQAVGSLIERLLYWSWGGRPSDRVLGKGLGRYLPEDAAVRIRNKLAARVGEDASTRSLFLHAMQLSEGAGVGRSARFNGLYAYHRSLVVLLLIGLVIAAASWGWGLLSSWYWWHAASVIGGLVLLLGLSWHRAKQRAMYYAREVILTAEKIIDERKLDNRQY